MKYKFLILTFVIVFIDQLTKFLMRDVHKNFDFFSLNYTVNSGALFGLFKGMNLIFIILSIIILGFILIYLYREKKNYLGFSFLISGLIGNLIDRVFLGHVIDFLDFKIWPVFNIADSALVIGVIILLFSLKKD